MDLFDQLPVSAIINNKFICVHGGISLEVKTVSTFLVRYKTSRSLIGRERYQNQGYFAT
jgi:diadenosine tetraphosphatase ApaH/serine/threonine PP2A family protein phosphatase